MKGWLAYAAASALLLLLLVVVVGTLVRAADPAALWVAAAVAYVVQLGAFALLLSLRRHSVGFMAGWAGGMLLRFAVIAGVAVWVTRFSGLDPATALVGLVGFVMVLVLIEPLFLGLAD